MRHRSLSVLVVDLTRSRKRDSELMDYLREKGFHSKAIRDPKRAADAIKRGPVHLVFLLLSARTSAPPADVLKRFQQANSDVPTIVISTRPSLPESVESLRGRAYDYLKGPCQWDELDFSVQSIIEEKGYLQTVEDRLQRMVGDRIREARQEKGLTLRQLAGRTEVSSSLISQIELARSSASVSTLFKLSRALGLKMTDLFAGF